MKKKKEKIPKELTHIFSSRDIRTFIWPITQRGTFYHWLYTVLTEDFDPEIRLLFNLTSPSIWYFLKNLIFESRFCLTQMYHLLTRIKGKRKFFVPRGLWERYQWKLEKFEKEYKEAYKYARLIEKLCEKHIKKLESIKKVKN